MNLRRILSFGMSTIVMLQGALVAFWPSVTLAAPEYADAPIMSSAASPEWITSNGRYVGVFSQTAIIPDGLGGGHFIRDRQLGQTTRINNITSSDYSVFAASDDLSTLFIDTSQALVLEDTNNTFDIYAFNRSSSTYELISLASDGTVGNGISQPGGISRQVSLDGRYVVFLSDATNLSSGSDTNSGRDVFIRDRQLHITRRLDNDMQNNAPANTDVHNASISAEGTSVVYAPEITTAVPGNLSTVNTQIIVQNLSTGVETRVSAAQGIPDSTYPVVTCRVPSLSDNGRFVAFTCSEPLLSGVELHHPHAYRYDMLSSNLTLIDRDQAGQLTSSDINSLMISDAGTRIVYQDYGNINYVWDAISGYAQILGNGQLPLISGDGNTIAVQETSSISRAGIWSLMSLVSDTVAPVVVGVVPTQPNTFGWFNTIQYINWSSTDRAPSTNIPNTPVPTLINQEGVHTYISGLSCDLSGNCSTGSYVGKLDTVLPNGSLGSANSNLIIKTLLNQTISGTATDSTSGVDSVVLTSGSATLSNTNGGLNLTCNAVRTSCDWSAISAQLPTSLNSTFTLKVTDFAGNVYTTTAQYTVL